MDGDVIADSLIKYADLWDSFLFGRFFRKGDYSTLIELRDLPEGHLNADTLMILTDKDRWDKLHPVINSDEWHADEIGYTGADDETWGTAPYADSEEVNAAMGGGFWAGGMEDGIPVIWREMAEGSPIGRKGPRAKKKKPTKIPILVRVWWD